ncbi:transposase family protein [Rhodococcus jostii]|uniref:transposase family protein n=1 Tax=Rhodococcus jostii TaxID=132919 RepID=UPI00362C3865
MGVAIDSIDVAGGGVSIRASPLSVSASCPTCGDTSERVHSRYERTVADAAIGNRPSRLVLRVRRFLCSSTACDRRTFAEQIDGVTTRYARRTAWSKTYPAAARRLAQYRDPRDAPRELRPEVRGDSRGVQTVWKMVQFSAIAKPMDW